MDTITLYHGSKSGLHGEISPTSRKLCDFGSGFYMGTQKIQPLTLICNYKDARFYTLKLDLTGLKVLNMELSIDWAMLIAFNRGKMENYIGTKIYEKYKNFAAGYDVIVGYIANDRMFVVLDRFFEGLITDTALISSLSALKLGKQYVAITQTACNQIKILEEKSVDEFSRTKLKLKSDQNRADGVRIADEMCRLHRRDGRFFDELL